MNKPCEVLLVVLTTLFAIYSDTSNRKTGIISGSISNSKSNGGGI